MRKIIFQNMISLDGYFEGPNRELDWHLVDAEFNDYAAGLLDSLDTLLFGRVTYELMAGYWPSSQALADDPAIAARMNRLHKVVFSRTLSGVDWNNSRLAKGNAAEKVRQMKQQPGKDMAIFGSSDLAVSLGTGLVDEYRIFIAPIFLGGGKTLLHGLKERLPLRLTQSRTFKSGLVLLSYQPAPPSPGNAA
jgi:dihydrofolate reductase